MPDRKTLVREPYQVLLLCCAVLTVYYVSITAEFCLLDDRDMVLSLSDVENFDLKGVLYPNTTSGGYYRPLIGLFYLVDRFAWSLDPQVMHLENILFHLLNVLLLFFIAKYLLLRQNGCDTYSPFWLALLFAVHPIATESVNWISGRTDLLAGIFVLSASLLLVLFRQQRPSWLWPLIGICAFLGVSAKETAIMVFFVGFFLMKMQSQPQNKPRELNSQVGKLLILTVSLYAIAVISALFLYNYLVIMGIVAAYGLALYRWDIGMCRRSYAKVWIGISCVVILSLSFFFMIRNVVFVSDIAQIPRTLLLIKADPGYAIKMCVGALGFYVKKALFPFPLNLAIREIDPLYELLGIALLFSVVFFIRLGNLISGLALSGFCLLLPALPFALGSLAWTAYAERYIYLALPFWLLAVFIGLNRYVENRRAVIVYAQRAVLVAILLIWLKGDLDRNLTWRSNVALFEDTTRKSPFFKITRGLYMLALFEKNRYDEALEQYRIASTLPSLEYDEKFDLVYGLICMRQDRFEEARGVFGRILKNKETVPVLENFLKLLLAMHSRLPNADPANEEIDSLVSETYHRLYRKTGNAGYIYRLGQFYLSVKKQQEAKKCFTVAAQELPSTSQLKPFAMKLARNLK